MVTSASSTGHGRISATFGLVGLILGATGEFLSLQDALNAVWRVEPDPAQGGVRRFLLKRLLSMAMTMGVAFLLVVSLALTAAIAFGAARAFAVILVWIYYAGILVLFGAEFTEHYAAAHGHPVAPKKGAVRLEVATVSALESR